MSWFYNSRELIPDDLLDLMQPGQVFKLGRPAPAVTFFDRPQLRGNRPPQAGTLRHGRRHRLLQRGAL